MQFLLIDSEPDFRASVRQCLEALGHTEIEEIETVRQALDALKSRRIDFIISEWNLSGADGYSLLKLIKGEAKLRRIPFLMISKPEKNEAEKVRKAARANVDGYLLKPFQEASFKASLENILARRTDAGESFGVLVVDDDADSRQTVVSYLEEFGVYPIYSAEDGSEGLQLLRQYHHHIILIISDWMMPKSDGLEFLRNVRREVKTSSIPFLMITSQTEDEMAKVMKAIHASVDAYLFKPFRIADFKEKMLSALRKGISARNYQERVAMGYLLMREGHWQEAVTFFEEASAFLAHRAEAHRALGECWFRLGMGDKGLQNYQQAMAINPLDEALKYELDSFLQGSKGAK